MILYLIEGDIDEAPLDAVYPEHQYVSALSELCRWLRDPDVFNVRFYILFFDDKLDTLISATRIKVRHM